MSGAGNDALSITSIPSSQEQTLPDKTKTSTTQDYGLSRTLPYLAVQETHDSTGRNPERTMANKEDAEEASVQLHPPKIRVYFDEFAAQIRLHKQQDRHSRLLRLRQESLQKSIALAHRLRRVGRIVQDGLVELSGHTDKIGFARVYHCINELSTSCHASWRGDIQAHDIPTEPDSARASGDEERNSFVSKLSRDSRKDLSRLLHSIRSEPKFLVDRIKALSQVQLEGVCVMPGQEPQSSVLPHYPQNRNSKSQSRRNAAFATSLEDFAISLERKEPLKFMLCNMFGSDQDPRSTEHWLRLDTWSSVCAELFLDSERYHKLIGQILYIFASFQPWRAAERLERHLMDVLQRGAVLIEAVDKTPASSFRSLGSEPLDTAEAEAFFEDAIQKMIAILSQHDGGLPSVASQFVSAVVGKLPEEHQPHFRGHVLFEWFLDGFLATAISYPENENMLLNCHISKHARATILHSLSRRFSDRVRDVFSDPPLKEVSDTMRNQVLAMVGWLESLEIDEHLSKPSQQGYEVSLPLSESNTVSSDFVVICPMEVISLLDTLCPLPGLPSTGGWDPFLMSAASAFQSQYARTNTTSKTTFDQLRRELSMFSDNTLSSRLLHPGLEQWAVLPVGADKRLDVEVWRPTGMQESRLSVERCFSEQDTTRQGAIRLASDYRKSYRHSSRQVLDDPATPDRARDQLLHLFYDEHRHAQDKADKIDARYWHQALIHLQDHYPLSNWAHDDTQVLKAPLEISRTAQHLLEENITRHENELLELKESYASQTQLISSILTRLDKLRNKLWYMVDVINSSPYEDAKNIASALNSIAGSLLSPGENVSEHSETASLAGSILSQSSRETVGMLKAPIEHGGPNKLSDVQVDTIRKWLKRSNIENFCKGEERIHRFCMEIKSLARRLTAENMNDSPVLWLSELFTKEKALCFDGGNLQLGNFGGTGTPSVRSETMSSIHHTSRSVGHGLDSGSRIPSYDAYGSPARKSSFHSLGSSRIRTDVQLSDGSSLNGSPDRAYSSAASDTVSSLASLWSPAAAQSQSATSISTRSRPPSTYNDVETAKLADQKLREKMKFLDELQQDLTCLLLSDLGCPVWSYGSETDAWLASTSADARVMRRIRQRHTSARLLSAREPSEHHKRSGRSSSVARLTQKEGQNNSNEPRPTSGTMGPFAYMEAYQILLQRCSQHIDPVEKLQAIYDMKVLVMAEMEDSSASDATEPPHSSDRSNRSSRSAPSSRRSSFDPSGSLGTQKRPIPKSSSTGQGKQPTSFVTVLQGILEKLKPKTLFRDLQYISVFVPQETLNKTGRGNALTDFGLAALAYKSDVAQAMVDVADRCFSEGSSRSSPRAEISLLEPKYAEASTFMLIAAREGNAVAQREVAGLYLTLPEMKQVISLPLTSSGETFKKENEWQKNKGPEETISSQAMCLALHWMQQAASNGDKIAKEKLKKRNEGIRIP